MDFFKMRITNTLLVLLIGAMLGYIAGNRGAAGRRAAGKDHAAPRVIAATETEDRVFQSFRDRAEGAEAPVSAVSGAADRTDDDYELPVRLPAGTGDEEAEERGSGEEPGHAAAEAEEDADEPAGKASGVLRGAEDDFFKNPGRFAGEDLEMELQMLTAARRPKGWLLNLARVRSGKSADYVYIEDAAVLGENPDLKIGYFYRTRFRCRKGDTASGNSLLEIVPTGDKAVWATGISAIE
ncbi:MAG TPA: hypothetical protein PL037_01600 [Elusimicrobiales bacterium]|nr:hypothetical protein [Elusimicrobiales bacterium]